MQSNPIDPTDPRVLAAIENEDALYAWAAIRAAGEPIGASAVAETAQIAPERIHGLLDCLEEAGLIVKLRATAERRGITYRSAVDALRFVVPEGPEGAQIYNRMQLVVQRFQESDLRRMQSPTDRAHGDHHIGGRWCLRTTEADFKELLTRMVSLAQFIRELEVRSEHLPPETELIRPHLLFLRVAPLVGKERPQPELHVVTGNFAEHMQRARRRAPESLTKRERAIALFLQGGLSRADVAKRLGVSVDTVGTHCKSIFRKLEIERATELAGFSFDAP